MRHDEDVSNVHPRTKLNTETDDTVHRRDLLEKLDRYAPTTQRDADARARVIDFVRDHPNCFQRSLAIGHITGSSWVVDSANRRVLLTHHRKLGKWLQLGGHADGEPDVLSVALREAKEESGIEHIEPVSHEVFDVDVHLIPKRGNEQAHYHYDIRFLLRVQGGDAFHVSEESIDLAWFLATDLEQLDIDDSVREMCVKWQRQS